ncbi:hypothetical protein GCM10022214_04940 [Actinomadura miaoliensis]|uniref:DUF397 domain-containing protein n=1 Tax=Actinomadura miaoliensis TaxID=430685 RepID=A0ABP7UZQ4_9ACTN
MPARPQWNVQGSRSRSADVRSVAARGEFQILRSATWNPYPVKPIFIRQRKHRSVRRRLRNAPRIAARSPGGRAMTVASDAELPQITVHRPNGAEEGAFVQA